MSSPVHPASLVDPSNHSPALLQLVDLKLSKELIEYLVGSVVETVDHAMGRPTPSYFRGRALSRRPEHAKFTTFVTKVLTTAEVTTPTVLGALVYIDRAKPHLHIALEEWALERVFLGAVIVASKYLNDSTLKNLHWALCTGVFGKRDVGRIEREFLDVLDFELSLTEDDILTHHAGISAAVYPSPPMSPTDVTSSRSSSHHQSRQHSHTHSIRHHHRSSAPVPELEPSSPESSEGSSSPQTPSTMVSSPISDVAPSKPAPSLHQKTSSTFHDILRSFPIPLPGTHRHRHAQQLQIGSHQFPIHVDA